MRYFSKYHIDGLMQDCCNSIANVLELLQSCTKWSTLHMSNHPNGKMIHRQPKLSFYKDEYAISWPWQYNVRVDVWPDNHTVIHHVTRRTQDVTGRHWYTDRYWDTMMTNGGTVIYQWGQFNRAPSSFIKHVVSVEWWSWMHVLNLDAYAAFGMNFVRKMPTATGSIYPNYDTYMESLNRCILNILVLRIIFLVCAGYVQCFPMAMSLKS